MELYFLLWQVVIVMAFNNNDNEVLIKQELLVLQEVGMLYRKKRLDQYNSNNKLIHPWRVHQQIQPTSHIHHTHTHTHVCTCTHTHTHTHSHTRTSKSNEVIYRKRWRK